MIAVTSKLLADFRQRKLQTAVIALVLLLSSGAATLALSLVVESSAPYDQAFARANGPHLVLTLDAHRVTKAMVRRTARIGSVRQTAGPWPQVSQTLASVTGSQPSGSLQAVSATIVGRRNPTPAVDRLTIESGGWAVGPRQIVLSQRTADQLGLSLGSMVKLPDASGAPVFRVSGIAGSISPAAGAWASPAVVRTLTDPQSPLQYQMMYRVHPSATADQLRGATQVIASRLPRGSVVQTSDYLSVRHDAEIITDVMVPFLLAFSAFALVASVLIIANVVAGVVIGSYREIGVMKSVGFTPLQVTAVLLGQVVGPALVGSLGGVLLGTLASRPFLQNTAHSFGLPASSTAAVPIDVSVMVLAVGVAIVASIVPAWRAGWLTAVGAVTLGTAPSGRWGSMTAHSLSQLPLPRVVSLGLQDAFARPIRSLMTVGSILVGVATLVFALSLHLSLGQVAAHLDRSSYAQIELSYPTGLAGGKLKGGITLPPPPTNQQTVRALRSTSDVSRFVSESSSSVLVPGLSVPVQYYAYRGTSSWLGYALISGRWFRRRGEVVAPTRLLTQDHVHVGQTLAMRRNGRTTHVRIVGEILDQTQNDLLLRGEWSTLRRVDPGAKLDDYEIQVKPGASPNAVAQVVAQRVTPNGPTPLSIDIRGGTDSGFVLLNGVIAGLAVILISIALAGVFNTVVLTTREKARSVAILKAVGMAPLQVVGMVLTSVAVLGAMGGIAGVPAGLNLHRQVIQLMGAAASGTRIPPAFFNLIPLPSLVLLALSGLGIAVLGAWLPSQWAASRGVSEVLQAE